MTIRKLAPLGVGLLASGLAMLPTAASARSLEGVKSQVVGSNTAVDVQTEVNCPSHMITAAVTNKTTGDITPQFVYQNEPVDTYDTPIKPGKTQNYFVPFSGNNLLGSLKVQIDGQQDLSLQQRVNCNEPVTFTVDKTSDSAVTGYLRNNSTFVGQTVFAKVNGGDTRVENLKPGESRLVALPFTPSTLGVMKTASGVLQRAFLTIGTSDGYEGTYSIDLNQAVTPLLSPLSTKK